LIRRLRFSETKCRSPSHMQLANAVSRYIELAEIRPNTEWQ
jgi:hypothetical protein